jgi:hypothetical protein
MLIKIVLSSMLTHLLTVFKTPQQAISDIDKFIRVFFGKDHIRINQRGTLSSQLDDLLET